MTKETGKDIEDFLLDNINLVSTKETICGLTGDKIKRAQPHLELFREVEIKIESFEEKISSDTTLINLTEGRELDIKTPIWGGKCELCDSEDSKIIELYKKEGIKEQDKKLTSLCENCWKEFVSKAKDNIENIKNSFMFYDDSGFFITDYSKETEFGDSLTGNMKKSKHMIVVGCDDVGDYKLYVGLSNIEKLVSTLSNPQKSDSSEVRELYECDICGKNAKEGIGITIIETRVPQFCKECTHNLLNSLEDYIDNNESLVMSKVI